MGSRGRGRIRNKALSKELAVLSPGSTTRSGGRRAALERLCKPAETGALVAQEVREAADRDDRLDVGLAPHGEVKSVVCAGGEADHGDATNADGEGFLDGFDDRPRRRRAVAGEHREERSMRGAGLSDGAKDVPRRGRAVNEEDRGVFAAGLEMNGRCHAIKIA